MNSTYVIGEIGQNHNGSVEIAKQIVDIAAQPIHDDLFDRPLKRMDAVKLTKRDLAHELSKSGMDRIYDSPNSFGRTYGEHRAALELNDEEHFEVYKYAKEKGMDFVETICAPGAMSCLKLFTPDYLKVASRDLTNLPLLEALAETKTPIIVSTGMAGDREIENAVEVITRHHSNLTILHCISEYPADYVNINLNTIPYLEEKFPELSIGYSDHSIGIMVPVAAVVLGAKVIEKHITLDRNMKGSDQKGSLEGEGIFRMMRDIRNVEQALGTKEMFIAEAVKATRVKLERSCASLREIKAGDIITEEDLHLLSPGDGFQWADRAALIGKKATQDIPADEIIYPNMID